MNLSLSSCIIILYLGGSLLISYLAHRKNTSLQSVLAAPKEFSLLLMVPLVFSGLFGGSTVTGTVADAFSGGVSSSWYLIGTALGCVLFVAVVLPFYRTMSVMKMAVSIPQAFSHRFDERVKILMVLVVVVTNALALSTIPLSTATIVSNITGTDYNTTTWIVCGLLILMTAAGGLKGVAAMNIVHTTVMFLGLIVLLVPCLNAAGGIGALAQALPASYFNFASTGLFSVIAVLLGAVLAIITSPLAVMTTVSSKDVKGARRSLLLCAVLIIPFAACLVLIGMCCKIIAPELMPAASLFTVAQSFSEMCYVFISMSVLAATFSTAPASLLGILTTLNNDIFRKVNKNASEQQQKLFVRLGMVILPMVLTFIGKHASSILGQLTGAAQIKSVAGVVLVISLYWKRVNKDSAFYSMLVGSVVAVGWHMAKNPFGIQPLWPSLAISLVVLVVMTAMSREKVSQDYKDYAEIVANYRELGEEWN